MEDRLAGSYALTCGPPSETGGILSIVTATNIPDDLAQLRVDVVAATPDAVTGTRFGVESRSPRRNVVMFEHVAESPKLEIESAGSFTEMAIPSMSQHLLAEKASRKFAPVLRRTFR